MPDISDNRESEGNANNCKEDAEEAASKCFWRYVPVPFKRWFQFGVEWWVNFFWGVVPPIVVKIVVEKKTAWM